MGRMGYNLPMDYKSGFRGPEVRWIVLAAVLTLGLILRVNPENPTAPAPWWRAQRPAPTQSLFPTIELPNIAINAKGLAERGQVATVFQVAPLPQGPLERTRYRLWRGRERALGR